MSRSSKRRLPAAAAAFAAAALASGCHTVTTEQPELWGQDVPLTILHTSDIHSRLLPYDFRPSSTDQQLGLRVESAPYGGIARMGAIIERERAKSQRSIHLDSGDCFQGAPIFNAYSGEVEVRWLSQMKADAVVVGNHEFDAGVRNFAKQYAAWGTYPLLAANYEWYDWRDPRYTEIGRLSQPYTIINAEGLRIAVIGMANISSLNSIGEEGNSIHVTPLEQNETLRSYVELLAPMVDLIGVVSHLGHSEDKELVEGYHAVYRRDAIQPFLEREVDPWVIDEQRTRDWKVKDGNVVVKIPGVRNLDFIAGGHLHIVTNPPQPLIDADGRNVVLFHSGAFSKFVGRLDLVVRMPDVPPEEQTPEQKWRGAEIVAHDYYAIPVDAVWCKDHRTEAGIGPDATTEEATEYVQRERASCEMEEHPQTLELLEEYVWDLYTRFDLSRIFAYAPREILRRASSAGADSPLGNMTAEAMRRRQGVEAEFAVTNTLGIRDSLYRGPITIESMFNVFPFENTINVMYLSGEEIQEMLDFVASRSSSRGCQSQAMVAGIRFTMNCAEGKAEEITLGGEPLSPGSTYKVAVNDYIAKGGSGFNVLQRNTTRIETGISLRDALIQYMQSSYCSCNELLADGAMDRCGANVVLERGEPVLDPLAVAYCESARSFAKMIGAISDLPAAERDARLLSEDAPTIHAGKCSCNDVLASDEEHRRFACGNVTPDLERFCLDPLNVPVVTGVEDNRIGRRLQ